MARSRGAGGTGARSSRGGGSSDDQRPGLTRERVLAAAVGVADEGGLARVTMRRVAESLGVEAMSLYHHVANKGALLDGMVDAVFAEMDRPAADGDWRPSLAAHARSTRAAMARHPWALGLMDASTSPGPATLGHHEAVLACLRAGGFSVAQAGLAYATLDAFIYGFVLQEASLPTEDGAFDGAAVAMMEAMPAEQYPHMVEMAVHAMGPHYDFGDQFEPGLALVLDGLDRLLAGG